MGSVGAVGIPDTVTVTTSNPWIIANNNDQTTITVTVTNTTPGFSGVVQGAAINLAIDPLYGILTPAMVVTDSSGMASSTFKVKTKSGAPQIIATHTAPGLIGTTIQNIDHGTPYYDPSFSQPLFTYPAEGPAAQEVPFKISMYDYYGNPVDNRRGNHTIDLHVSSPQLPDDCGFNDGGVYPHDISLPLDANGTVSVNARLTSKIGYNYVRMGSIGAIPFKIVPIQAVAVRFAGLYDRQYITWRDSSGKWC